MSSTQSQPELQPNALYHGDAAELTAALAENSVALSVWSPPYFVGKQYERELTYASWQAMLERTIAAHHKALVPGGFMVVNIADILCFPDPEMPRIQAPNVSNHRSPVTRDDVLAARQKHPHYNRNQLAELLGCSEQTIDRRLNGNNIRGGKYSPQTRVQLVGHLIAQFAAQADLFLYDRRVWVKDPCWENCQWHANSYRSVDEFEYLYFFWKPGETKVDRNRLSRTQWAQWGSRAVWSLPSVRANVEHEAQFPLELPRRLIQLLTDPGDLVLDPFVGSGTTALAAQELGRLFVGFDKEEKYVELGRARLGSAEDAEAQRTLRGAGRGDVAKKC